VIAQVVSQSLNAAQVFFLVGFILLVIVTVWQLFDRAIQAALLSAALAFVGAGSPVLLLNRG
jgi:hypothetical protein